MSSDLKWLKRLDTLGMHLGGRGRETGSFRAFLLYYVTRWSPARVKALCLDPELHTLCTVTSPPRTYSAVTLCWQVYCFLLQFYLLETHR